MAWLFLFFLLFAQPAMSAEAAEPRSIAGLLIPFSSETLIPLPPSASEAARDRWGRLVLRDSNLAESLLRDGQAQIFPDTEKGIPASWWSAEAEARRALRGVWGQECCRVLKAEGAAPQMPLEAWRVVDGVVTAVKGTQGGVYVNFSPHPDQDWRTDFTLKMSQKMAARSGAFSWVGQRVLVRGFIQWNFGPMIELDDLAQVQLEPEN